MVEILGGRRIPLPLAYSILDSLDEELKGNPIVSHALEHARSFSKCSPEDAAKALEELMKLGLSDFASSMIIDIAPSSLEEAKALLADIEGGYSEEVLAKALEIVSSRCRKAT